METFELVQIVDRFVDQLNGRYKDYVSDIFLKALMLQLTQNELLFGNPRNHDVNNAYNVGCVIFESILEYQCEAGGNGHHVAQDFAKHF